MEKGCDENTSSKYLTAALRPAA